MPLVLVSTAHRYYICRSTFVFSAPVMRRALGLTITDVGLITSAFPAVYGVAKLFGGVIADVNSPRAVLAGGLIAVSVCNFLFALGSGNVAYFAALWGALGLVSSVGFPACAALLSNWFPPSIRGRAWGTLNISLNLGGLTAPVLVGGLASTFGWRYGIMVPAAIAMLAGCFTYLAVVDSPEDAGLVPESGKAAGKAAGKAEASSGEAEDGLVSRLNGAVAAFRRQLFDGVLTVRPIWLLAIAYFFVYVIRQGLTCRYHCAACHPSPEKNA